MDWSDDNRERLEVALTEADVVGLRLNVHKVGAVDVLLHVLALPESGPMENDPRRILRFFGVDDVSVLLRRVTRDGNGPPTDLADLDAVEEFFESLVTGESLYGWRYFDDPSLTEDWPSNRVCASPLTRARPRTSSTGSTSAVVTSRANFAATASREPLASETLRSSTRKASPRTSMSSLPTALGGGGACRTPTLAFPLMPRARRASAKSSGVTGQTSRGRRSRQPAPEPSVRAHYPDSRGRLRDAYQASGRSFHIWRAGKSTQSWR